MGTRADFYVGRGPEAEWLGSIAWDGHPVSIDESVLSVTTEADYRAAVAEFLRLRNDATFPANGWPWPWKDSNTTDYAYAFEGDAIYASSFGYPWFAVDLAAEGCGEPEESQGPKGLPFPNMTDRQNVTYGPRSGVMVFQVPR